MAALQLKSLVRSRLLDQTDNLVEASGRHQGRGTQKGLSRRKRCLAVRIAVRGTATARQDPLDHPGNYPPLSLTPQTSVTLPSRGSESRRHTQRPSERPVNWLVGRTGMRIGGDTRTGQCASGSASGKDFQSKVGFGGTKGSQLPPRLLHHSNTFLPDARVLRFNVANS